MKTKIVYTVVSGSQDVYLPQVMVASYTARKTNPTAQIVLVVDQETNVVINNCLPNIKKYVSEIIVVNVPDGMNKMHRSRYLKTTLRQHISGDFLFVDADTVITCDLSEIDDVDMEIAAVLDRHSPVSEHELVDGIKSAIIKLSLNLQDLKDKYFNSGVMLVKDSPIAYQLYERWYENWNKSLTTTKGIDQPPLALANKQCGYPIQELNGIWNCQLSDNFLNYFFNAKVLHYFASNKRSPYLLYDQDIFKEVLDYGDIPGWLIEQLEHPYSFFKPHHLLVYGDDLVFVRSHIHVIYKYHPFVYKIMEFFSKMLVTKKFF